MGITRVSEISEPRLGPHRTRGFGGELISFCLGFLPCPAASVLHNSCGPYLSRPLPQSLQYSFPRLIDASRAQSHNRVPGRRFHHGLSIPRSAVPA